MHTYSRLRHHYNIFLIFSSHSTVIKEEVNLLHIVTAIRANRVYKQYHNTAGFRSLLPSLLMLPSSPAQLTAAWGVCLWL